MSNPSQECRPKSAIGFSLQKNIANGRQELLSGSYGIFYPA
jgi:hypothetical protein